MLKEILFLCTGNTCRSPMAEVIARDLFGETARFTSRGASVFAPSRASADAEYTVELEFGLSLANHTARELTEADIARADLILTMTRAHKDFVLRAYPAYADKCFTLCAYTTQLDQDIRDPYGMDIDAYRACARELRACIEKLSFESNMN